MYQRLIAEILKDSEFSTVKPHHVEAWMRLEHGTLDGLDRPRFKAEVLLCAYVSTFRTYEQNEQLANSYGLRASKERAPKEKQ